MVLVPNKYRLWKFFRITPEEYENLKKYQKSHPVFSLLLGKRISTDHNHTSGEVRGLLEWRLNRAYGLIEKAFPKNTADVLHALALFHEHPPMRLIHKTPRYGIIGLARNKKKYVYGSEKGPIKQRKGM